MRRVIIYLFILTSSYIFSQERRNYDISAFRILNISGEINLLGEYRDFKYSSDSYKIKSRKNDIFSLAGKLKVKSYVWHPNFLKATISLIYNPSVNNENSFNLISFKQKQVNRDANIELFWFSKKKVKFSNTFNVGETLLNRDFIGNTKQKYLKYGGSVHINIKKFPILTSFSSNHSDYEDIDNVQRSFSHSSQLSNIILKPDFGKFQRTELSFSNQNYSYQQKNKSVQKTLFYEILLRNQLDFINDESGLVSLAIMNNRKNDNYERQVKSISENVRLKITRDLNLFGGFNYFKTIRDQEVSVNKILNARITHRIYHSLTNTIEFSNSRNNYPAFQFNSNELKFNIDYQKKIPFNGKLKIKYSNSQINDNKKVFNLISSTFNEQYKLVDDDFILLNNGNIDINSVIIRNETGSVIYELNFDYFLIQQGDYIQIKRVPGGQIANNDNVIVEYNVQQRGSYNIKGNRSALTINTSLFNFLNLYFRAFNQNFKSDEFLEVSYDKSKQKVFGTTINVKSFNFDLSYDTQKSLFFPYKLLNAKLSSFGNFGNKLNFSINGGYRNYFMIFEEGQKQKQATINAFLNYNLSSKSNVSFLASYSNHESSSFIYKTMVGKVKFNTVYRKLGVDFSVSRIHTQSNEQNTNLFTTSLRIIRNF